MVLLLVMDKQGQHYILHRSAIGVGRRALGAAYEAAERAGIERTFVEVGDLRMHTLRYGQGRPLLLLHGWPEFCLVWQPMMEALGDSFQLIAPDLRGFGETGKTSDQSDATATADRHAEDVLALATALELERFGLVSGDVGAYIAQAACHLAPDRIDGAFYFCTPYPGIGARYGDPSHLIEVWYQYFQQLPWAAELASSSRETCRLYIKHFLDHWSGDNPAVFEDKLEVYVDNYMKPGNMQGGFDWYLRLGPQPPGVARRNTAAPASDRRAHPPSVGATRSADQTRVGGPAR